MTEPGANRRAEARRSFRMAVAVLLFCLVAVAIYGWYMLRDSDVSTVAVIALAGGVVLTLVVGIGLMTLLFYSSREGFDEQVHRRK
jgi:membrane protein YdbS with pleckstrin-like domain